jgi:hypothetical protein
MNPEDRNPAYSGNVVKASVAAAIIAGMFGIAGAVINIDAKHDREIMQKRIDTMQEELQAKDSEIQELRQRHGSQVDGGVLQAARERAPTLYSSAPSGGTNARQVAEGTVAAPPAAAPTDFQTESYRLAVDNLKQRGPMVDVTLLLESQVDDLFRLCLSNPYLLDRDGTRLEVDADSSGELMRGCIEVLPHTKVREHLSFCIMSAPTSGFSASQGACTGKPLSASSFTLAADESRPRSGRKILLQIAKPRTVG